MIKTQIYLTEDEREKLSFLCSMLDMPHRKKDALRAAAGLWADRQDLPDFSSLRKEFNSDEKNG